MQENENQIARSKKTLNSKEEFGCLLTYVSIYQGNYVKAAERACKTYNDQSRIRTIYTYVYSYVFMNINS